jgi:hypothetical protein
MGLQEYAKIGDTTNSKLNLKNTTLSYIFLRCTVMSTGASCPNIIDSLLIY